MKIALPWRGFIRMKIALLWRGFIRMKIALPWHGFIRMKIDRRPISLMDSHIHHLALGKYHPTIYTSTPPH